MSTLLPGSHGAQAFHISFGTNSIGVDAIVRLVPRASSLDRGVLHRVKIIDLMAARLKAVE